MAYEVLKIVAKLIYTASAHITFSLMLYAPAILDVFQFQIYQSLLATGSLHMLLPSAGPGKALTGAFPSFKSQLKNNLLQKTVLG